ncbi:leucyl aminopeptidase [Spiroplasma sabaudiense Ar-1343]|uniref:Probable cytosol aminopeptidase n=1 Tax=Spiroplasma sabaudiense Ar-1343 TaxID=1276257 RepID=W6A9A3_9MOLU|nr:M17 family metallopeptidase [Spiroplasma sabaudiense]AHI53607.1 leucyl aminopeptidase [Spiroplasma sabaudiense Ar-1343]
MITLNKNNQEIFLKPILVKEIKNSLISKVSGKASLISEDKTLYLTIGEPFFQDPYFELSKAIKEIYKDFEFGLTISFDEFESILNCEELVFDAIVESLFWMEHQELSLKTTRSVVKKNYNILTKKDFDKHFLKTEIKMEFVNFARDLQDTPPNICTATYFGNQIQEKAKAIANVSVKILDKKEIEKLQMGMLLAVNAASYEEPRVVVVEYCSDANLEKTVLVGKGITFDSGGYSLKPASSMKGMKFDMTGAAVTCSTVLALAKNKAKANVAAVAVLTDNRIGGKGTLVESVVKSMNGKTVEILNTDAEGRLVLGDGLTYAVRNLKADRLIDVATLTGAIRFCLGTYMTGAFATNNEFYQEFELASHKGHEEIWRMPIHPQNFKYMRSSSIADLANIAPVPDGGSSNAAAFLAEFSEGRPLIHLDIAATGHTPTRGNAIMLKNIFELLNH